MISFGRKSKIFENSRIAVTEKEISDLTKMLEDQQNMKIEDIYLLYRASQNDFSTQKFHENCDYIEHTLTLVQTEFGKKIGGYTPLCWSVKKMHSQQDFSKKSFVFSLTNNHKFTLEQQGNAISHNPIHGPTFGGMDFRIGNNAHTKDSSITNISCSYLHPEYRWGHQESITKFAGVIKGDNFKVKQWEVYVVKWVNQPKLNSKIAVSEKEISDLKKMIEDQQGRKIQQISLLYRASQNDFSIYSFHENCDMIKHTVTLIQTEFGKKIGGYTPLYWDASQKGYKVDKSESSFIFSLTNNHKFTSRKQNCRIFNDPNQGPNFGLWDLHIQNRANKNNTSTAILGQNYFHPDYQFENQESIRKFSGAIKGNNFKIKQWQVLVVRWETNKKIDLSQKEISDLRKMLEDQQNKAIKQLKLLYRASQNNFCPKIFHKLCDSIEHTVTIIQTEYGKKIGGYTPLKWNVIIRQDYQEDPSEKSFIFSLTNNHKFTLTNPQKAIYKYSYAGPSFGQDIILYYRWRTQTYSNVGHSYSHPEYNQKPQATIKFTGSQFLQVKEWQVYQVVWEQAQLDNEKDL